MTECPEGMEKTSGPSEEPLPVQGRWLFSLARGVGRASRKVTSGVCLVGESAAGAARSTGKVAWKLVGFPSKFLPHQKRLTGLLTELSELIEALREGNGPAESLDRLWVLIEDLQALRAAMDRAATQEQEDLDDGPAEEEPLQAATAEQTADHATDPVESPGSGPVPPVDAQTPSSPDVSASSVHDVDSEAELVDAGSSETDETHSYGR